MQQEEIPKSQNNACKTPRWRLLQAQLNNLKAVAFQEKMKSSTKTVLIDVRTAEEFTAMHLEGAININYFAEDMWERLEQLQSADAYLVYCRSGRRSIRVCTLMKNGGFDADKIFNLEGGLIAWQEQMK